MQKENKLLDGFFCPHPDYRPATMWFWNDEMQEYEISSQLEAFKSKGINDFFVSHTWGTLDDYLGERFFEVVKYTVKESERLGLHFWIYDEFNWPSGTAGGKVLRDHPETRAKLLVDNKEVLGPNGSLGCKYIKGEFEAAKLVYCNSPEDGAVDVTDKIEIEKNAHGFWAEYKNNCCADIELHIMSVQYQDNVEPSAKWGKYSFNQPGYVDAFDEKAIRLFIDYTHEKYKEAVGEHFGKTVKGVFTDEVCLASPHDVSRGTTPWNDNLKKIFKERYGYDLDPWYHVMVDKPKNPQEKKARYDYWRMLTELFSNAHLKQVYEWCDKENLKYTGHVDAEEILIWTMLQSGDIFDLLKWMHIPGIDSIISRDRIETEEFNIAGKILGSCARFFNKDRTLCETYTCSSHKLRFDEMKRISNRLMVLGVNMLQYMGCAYSWDGLRKDPSPIAGAPNHGESNPLFKHYDLLGDYMSRIQYVSAQTKPCGRVLVLWPQAGVYVNSNLLENMSLSYAQRKNNKLGRYEIAMEGVVNALMELNIEFDMFGDSMAKDASVENGKIKFYGGEYDVVVMPYTGDTTSGVMNLVQQIKNSDVRAVFVDELPQLSVDEAKIVSPFGATPDKDGLTYISSNVRFISVPGEEKNRRHNARLKALMAEAVGEERRTLDIRYNGTIYTSERSCEGAKVYFLANDKMEECTANIVFREGMKLLDPDTGNCRELKNVGGRADIHFDPYQMYILVEDEQQLELSCDKAAGEVVKILSANCGLELVGGNTLATTWKFAPYTKGDVFVIPQDDQLIPIPTHNIPGKYCKTNGAGMQVCDFEIKKIPKALTLFAEYGEVLYCELNGVRIDDKWSHCRLWGPKEACLDITALVKEGSNRIAMTFSLPDYNTPYRTPFVMLRGDFETENGVICGKRSDYIAAPVNTQGYTTFAGEVVYQFKTVLTAEEAVEAAFLMADTRDATELFVNGVSAGVRLWAPSRFNVEGMLKEGENELELRMVLPMWNFFYSEKEVMNMGLMSAPRLEKKAQK